MLSASRGLPANVCKVIQISLQCTSCNVLVGVGESSSQLDTLSIYFMGTCLLNRNLSDKNACCCNAKLHVSIAFPMLCMTILNYYHLRVAIVGETLSNEQTQLVIWVQNSLKYTVEEFLQNSMVEPRSYSIFKHKFFSDKRTHLVFF
jgi:hypothetical protein